MSTYNFVTFVIYVPIKNKLCVIFFKIIPVELTNTLKQTLMTCSIIINTSFFEKT